jgi:hypothetical protein
MSGVDIFQRDGRREYELIRCRADNWTVFFLKVLIVCPIRPLKSASVMGIRDELKTFGPGNLERGWK